YKMYRTYVEGRAPTLIGTKDVDCVDLSIIPLMEFAATNLLPVTFLDADGFLLSSKTNQPGPVDREPRCSTNRPKQTAARMPVAEPPSPRNIAAPLLHRRRHHHEHDEQRHNDKRQADRPRDEHRGIALRHQHGAAQVLFHHRAKHEAEQQRRRREAELRPHETE